MEISRSALEHNYSVFRALIPAGCNLMAVAKSNAYGHDFMQYARAMEALGIDWFGVDSITEALALRKCGIVKPILVLGYTLRARFAEAAANDISLTVSSFDSLRSFASEERIPKLHIKIDTGMHRQGFLSGQIDELVGVVVSSAKLQHAIEGAYTHFAAAKNPSAYHLVEGQIALFEKSFDMLEKAGLRILKHAAATGAALSFPQTHYGMVRIGIGLYGLWPSPEIAEAFKNKISLRPALSWKTVVSEIKEIPAGESIGYDFTETVTRKTIVAVCPIGYWHGYPRSLSNVGYVALHGGRAKILGRISMDMICIDVTHIPGVAAGDEVALIDCAGDNHVTPEEVANWADTTNYEICTRLNPLMKRIYI
jgi:alanine racemase